MQLIAPVLRNFCYILAEDEKHFLHLLSVLACLCMIIKEDIHMVPFDTASAVFCGVDHSIDHYLASVRNNAWIYGDGMAGFRDGTGAGASSPPFGALFTRTISGGTEETEGF